MADVKVCDRCGKRLGEERMEFNLKPVTTIYKLSAVLFKKPNNRYWTNEPDSVKTEHDLCIVCATKLSDWMQSGEMEETTHD